MSETVVLKPNRRRPRPSVRALVALGLLVVGVQFWLGAKDGEWGETRQLVALLCAVVAGGVLMAVRPLRDAAFAVTDWLRHPSPVARRVTAVVVAIGSAAYLYHTAVHNQHRQLGPVLHDEYCYEIQARMLAKGRLWMPAHELGKFFDSFHLITDKVFAVKYTPGTAMVSAPAVALGAPFWATPLALSALSTALLYLILTQFIDGLAGLLGAVMMLAVGVFRRVSVEMLSQPPMLFWVLVALWAFLHWRRNRGTAWLVLMSAAVGAGAITRPVDAVSLALPLAAGVLVELWGAAGRQWLRTVGLALLVLAPFLVLQLVCNKGTTGHWTKLPWVYYANENDPYDAVYGPRNAYDVSGIRLPQKRLFAKWFSADQSAKHQSTPLSRRVIYKRMIPAVTAALPSAKSQAASESEGGDAPSPMLMALVPLGLVGMLSRRRWVAVGFMAGYLLIYSGYPFVLDHYIVPAMPALILLALAGWDWLADNLPPLGRPARVIGGLAILALAVTALPQFQADPDPDDRFMATVLRDYDERLARLQGPSIVLFRFDERAAEAPEEAKYARANGPAILADAAGAAGLASTMSGVTAAPAAVVTAATAAATARTAADDTEVDPRLSVHAEPAYNPDVAWPDDARVIRAHDLGPEKNQALYDYYAKTAPDRVVYVFDRAARGAADPLTRLGTVKFLHERGDPRASDARGKPRG